MNKTNETEKEFALSDIDRAIYYVDASRQTHMDTIRSYRENPESLHEKVDLEEAVGNEVFHLVCIDEYNHVLRVLAEYKALVESAKNMANTSVETEVKAGVEVESAKPKVKIANKAKN